MNRLAWEQQYGQAALAMLRSAMAERARGAVAAPRPELELPEEGHWRERAEGVLVPVISKTDFSFDGRLSSTQSVTLAAGIDTASWVSGVVQVRLHAQNTWSTTAVLSVLVENVSLVPEDPSVLFVTPGGIVGAVTVVNASTPPSLIVGALNLGPIAGMVQVRLTWAQGASTPSAAQTCALSIDLIGRSG